MIITRLTSARERMRLRRKARQAARLKERQKARRVVTDPAITEPSSAITLTETEAKALDAYYTRPHVAKFVANVMRTFAPKDAVYLEPSAGGGAILDQFPDAIGLDLCPTRGDIIKADFLKADVAKVAGLSADQRKRLVIVGNPPFGVGTELAVKFLNKALTIAPMVGFVMPFGAGYHDVQRHVDPRARLLVDIVLPRQSFRLAGKAKNVMSRFQVWTTDPNLSPGCYVYQGEVKAVGRGKKATVGKARITCRMADDLRQREADVLECEDFTVERCRKKRTKLFNVAIPFRRGGGYNGQITRDPTALKPTYEYWLFRVRSGVDIETVVARLLRIDAYAIALKHNNNGQKAVAVDVIREYARLKTAAEACTPVNETADAGAVSSPDPVAIKSKVKVKVKVKVKAKAQPANDDNPQPANDVPSCKISTGDCLDVMATMADGSVDLIVTSPPYNLGNYAGGKPSFSKGSSGGVWSKAAIANGYASYSDDMPWVEYVAWQKHVLAECWRLIPEDGAIFYNHKPRPVKGRLLSPLELIPEGVNLRQVITWDRGCGMNFNRSFFLPTTEWIMLLLAKPAFKLTTAGGGDKDVWRIRADSNTDHPAPFPVELAARAIRATSAKVIFDPFSGSGTTGVAAVAAGRHFIGAELDPGYAAKARARIAAINADAVAVAA